MRLFTLCLLLVSTSTFARSLTIMNYNVENLFDTIHDQGKLDYTYLPKKTKDASKEIQKYCKSLTVRVWREECFNLDWNESVVNAKMNNIARVIRASNNGKGADIIVFQEVENKRVLKQLIDRKLKGLGYKYISLIEGPDERGIDVGMISRFKILKEKLNTVDINERGDKSLTRGILEVTFEVANKKVTIFGNHWPSQGNPDSHRVRASEVLLENALKLDSDLVIATGDFNTLDTDFPHGLNTNILPYFVDIEEVARRQNNTLNPGTHWYMTEWSSLDKMLVLKSTIKNAIIDYASYSIQAFDFVVGPKSWTNYDTGEVTIYEGVPKRFDPKRKTGFSDHLSIVSTFQL